jgi:hypothetical protein
VQRPKVVGTHPVEFGSFHDCPIMVLHAPVSVIFPLFNQTTFKCDKRVVSVL